MKYNLIKLNTDIVVTINDHVKIDNFTLIGTFKNADDLITEYHKIDSTHAKTHLMSDINFINDGHRFIRISPQHNYVIVDTNLENKVEYGKESHENIIRGIRLNKLKQLE